MTKVTELPIPPIASEQVYIETLLGFIEAARKGNMTFLQIDAVINGESCHAGIGLKSLK